MEHSLTLASILTLLIPMPLLIVFSTISVIRQNVAERKKHKQPTSPANVSTLVEKRGTS